MTMHAMPRNDAATTIFYSSSSSSSSTSSISPRPKIVFATGTKNSSGNAPRGIPTPEAVEQRAKLPLEVQNNSIYCTQCITPHFYVPKAVPIVITDPYEASDPMIERLEGIPCLRRTISILHIAVPSQSIQEIPASLHAARRLVEARVGRHDRQRLLPNLRKVVYHGDWTERYQGVAAVRLVEKTPRIAEDVEIVVDGGARPSYACVVKMRGHFVHRNEVGFECVKTEMP
ncbi:hypothetical protein BD626DRAFT_508262 [Schizophyllum amplum]|uniref:Uncharacterized protein n=1 Tax=Schizophyllum amplum TaxID=97359 RepID=A0A550C3P8_9AGAR|nr:hypothetical protein BD626DRAFT_508262 [Auriculariopsis ampla]